MKKMIVYKKGNIFESKMACLVNPVNTVGVMDKGLALAFKKKYPRMFRVYQTLCKRRMLEVGAPWLWTYTPVGVQVLLFPTKVHWRAPSKPHYIGDGLRTFADRVHNNAYADPVTSIAFPALGCGLGGLDFETQVRPLMEMYLSELPIDVEVYLQKR